MSPLGAALTVLTTFIEFAMRTRESPPKGTVSRRAHPQEGDIERVAMQRQTQAPLAPTHLRWFLISSAVARYCPQAQPQPQTLPDSKTVLQAGLQLMSEGQLAEAATIWIQTSSSIRAPGPVGLVMEPPYERAARCPCEPEVEAALWVSDASCA